MERECPVCNENTTNVVCQFEHAICDECLKQYIQPTCSLCRSELLPEFKAIATKNKMRDEQLSVLKSVADILFQGVHAFLQAFSITKDSIPEKITLNLDQNIDCSVLLKSCIDQITTFAVDPEYSFSKNPWCELILNRGSIQYKRPLFQITV